MSSWWTTLHEEDDFTVNDAGTHCTDEDRTARGRRGAWDDGGQGGRNHRRARGGRLPTKSQSSHAHSGLGPHHPHRRGPQPPPSHHRHGDPQLHPQPHHRLGVDHNQLALEQEPGLSSILTPVGVPLSVKELKHDDRVDCAADASVIDSVNGPSLLVERVSHESAVHTGYDRVSSEDLNLQDLELTALVANDSAGFATD